MNTTTNYHTADVVEEYVSPPVNVCETENEIVLEAEMPGVDKNGLEVTTDGNELVILGKRMKTKEEGDSVWQEISPLNYKRVFTLGDHIDRSKIHAAFEAGILTLKLGKAEDVKPKKIEIQFS